MNETHNDAKRIVPVILSGGSGTRLWPLSTADRPKQFLALTDPVRSMFQLTLARCADPCLFAAPIIVTNQRHGAIIEEQLDACGVVPRAIILEPAPRNTAPAIALAALEAGEDALMLVMPSDHRIADTAAFVAASTQAALAARQGALVTFGIEPARPETGYGYIARGDAVADHPRVFAVNRFVEKPDATQAQAMLDSGYYLWNAGIFLFSARRYLEELARHEPDIERCARTAIDGAKRTGTIVSPDATAFESSPSQSIDYGVMERSDDVVTVPLSCGWSDVGSWDAIADLAGVDSAGNYVHSEGARVSLVGVNDMIVVATGDEVMIVPRGQSQLVRALAEARRDEA